LVMAGSLSFGPKMTANSRRPHALFDRRGMVRRSSNAVHEAASQVAMWWGWTPPDPGFRMAIEVGGGDAGDVGDVVVVGQRLTGEGLAAEEAPASSPAFHQVEPGSPDGNEGVVDAWMRGCVDAWPATREWGHCCGWPGCRRRGGGRPVDRRGQASGAARGSQKYCARAPFGSAPARPGRPARHRSRPCRDRAQSLRAL